MIVTANKNGIKIASAKGIHYYLTMQMGFMLSSSPGGVLVSTSAGKLCVLPLETKVNGKAFGDCDGIITAIEKAVRPLF